MCVRVLRLFTLSLRNEVIDTDSIAIKCVGAVNYKGDLCGLLFLLFPAFLPLR